MEFSDFCFGMILDNLDSAKKFRGLNLLEIADKNSSIGEYLKEIYHDVEVSLRTRWWFVTDQSSDFI